MTVKSYLHPFRRLRVAFHDAIFQILKIIFESHKAYHRRVEFKHQYALKCQYI